MGIVKTAIFYKGKIVWEILYKKYPAPGRYFLAGFLEQNINCFFAHGNTR